MPKNIAFYVDELSNAYSLKTLYDYVKKELPEENMFFVNTSNSPSIRNIIGDTPYLGTHMLCYADSDLVVRAYSDVTSNLKSGESRFRNIAIDAAILKACKPLRSKQEKEQIKKEYGLNRKKSPLIVLGRVPYSINAGHQHVIRGLMPHGQMVIVAASGSSIKPEYLPSFNEEEQSQIIEVEGRGHLEKLYAVADVSLTGYHLKLDSMQLTNFYEQTQNCPVFILPPENTSQYGYKNMVKEGMVVECETIGDIIRKSSAYLKQRNTDSVQEHINKRAKFTEETRKKELPKIVKTIKDILDSSKAKKTFRYQHPESDWTLIHEKNYSHNSFTDIYPKK